MRGAPRRLRGALVLLAALLAVSGANPQRRSISLVLIRDVPAFESTRAGFLAQIPSANVVELQADLSNARASLETLRNEQPDIVVALGSSAALAVSEYLPHCPLVFGLVLQPGNLSARRAVRQGFTLSVHPQAKLAALSRVFSPLEHVVILCAPGGAAECEGLVAAAEAQGVRADVLRIAHAGEISPAMRGLESGAQVLLLTTDPVFLEEDVGRAIVMRAFERRVPVVGFSEKTVRLGGLAAFEIDYRAHGAELARAALDAANGKSASPAVRASSQYRWVVNPQTARSLGIAFPPELFEGGESGARVLGALP